MVRVISRGRLLLALVASASLVASGGCGEDGSNKPSTLPDQGKPVLPRPPGEMKKEKGMDRYGS